MILYGLAVSGLGKAAHFTQLAWVRSQFIAKLNIELHPGTFNVRLVEPDELERWSRLKQQLGIEIENPADTSCAAVCYPVLVNDTLRGAILIPGVPGYPPDQVEIVASQPVRGALGVKDGDPISLRLLD